LYDYRDSRNVYNFLNLNINPAWNSVTPKFAIENITTDGKTFKLTKSEVLHGTYFFLSEQRIIHSREVYNIIDLLSEFGGFYALLSKLLFLIGFFIN